MRWNEIELDEARKKRKRKKARRAVLPRYFGLYGGQSCDGDGGDGGGE